MQAQLNENHSNRNTDSNQLALKMNETRPNVIIIHPHTRVLQRRIANANANPNPNRRGTQTPQFLAKKKRWISLIQKILWTVSVLVSSTLCVWHLGVCLSKYLAQPIATKVKVEKFMRYTLPGLTVCPATYEMTYNFEQQFEKLCRLNPACNASNRQTRQRFPFKNMNVTLLDLWKPNTSMTTDTKARCYYAVNYTQCNSTDWIEKGSANTIAGPCQVYHTNVQWHFVGKSWLFWIEMTNISDLPPIPFMADVQASKSTNVMFIGKSFIYRNQINALEISATKFEYLNTTRNPCITEEQEIRCNNDWFTATLQTPDIKCRWPFVNSTLPYCDSMHQVEELKNKIVQRQFGSRNVQCLRPCSVTTYRLTTTYGQTQHTRVSTYITIILKTDTREIVTEYFAYPLSSFISDVGGSIGFFLGLSILSACKFLLHFLNNELIL